jgi:phosphatidylglycerol:prolipoprotein diacylglycerol transferase
VSFPAHTLPWLRHVDAGWISPAALHSLPVHPKQLYAAFAGFALLALLIAYFPRRRRDGEVMALLMITYPITRFLVEFYRGDASGWHAGLTISQYISLALVAGGVLNWVYLSRLPRGRFADEAATSEISATPPGAHLASRPHVLSAPPAMRVSNGQPAESSV